MVRTTADEAKAHLDELIEAAIKGEQVVIADGERRAVQLVPVRRQAPRTRQAGTAKGQIVMSADFAAPLADFDEDTRSGRFSTPPTPSCGFSRPARS